MLPPTTAAATQATTMRCLRLCPTCPYTAYMRLRDSELGRALGRNSSAIALTLSSTEEAQGGGSVATRIPDRSCPHAGNDGQPESLARELALEASRQARAVVRFLGKTPGFFGRHQCR